MRAFAGVWFVVAGVLLCSQASAEDVGTLKKELEEMRQQFETMKNGYEKAINQLGERIKALEARPPAASGGPRAAPAQAAPPGAPSAAPTVAAPPASPAEPAAPGSTAPGPPPAVAAPPASPTAPAPPGSTAPGAPPAVATPPAPPSSGATVAQAPPEAPSVLDLVRPREPFALYQRRGAGQLLFDVGLAGDFIGDLTQNNVQQAQGGTFPGLENYFFPEEIELSLFGQIDPYARAEVRIEASQNQRGQDIDVTLAEANLTLMTLPFGTQAKLGQMRARFGLTNQIHEHDLPFIDRPDVLVQFFGQDGLVEKGGEATWVPPLPFFLELLGGVFNGDNETAFGLASIKNPLVTGRVRTFFDWEDLGALQVGMSVANGLQPDRLNNLILGWDAKYKYVPPGWQQPLLTVAGELLYQIRQVEAANPAPGQTTETLNRYGWYLFGETQPVQFGFLSRFAPGVRFDWTEYPTNPGHQWAVEPYLSYMPSEFLRFRIGYKHTHGNTPGCCTNTGVGSARIKDEPRCPLSSSSVCSPGAHGPPTRSAWSRPPPI
ncbi:MAG TPA: hypothetical protein VMS64_22265 [Candidatus Methylomirabilis sp.]|nr:hypothetical protein [Candidatus Methylomirabilis sp.]